MTEVVEKSVEITLAGHRAEIAQKHGFVRHCPECGEKEFQVSCFYSPDGNHGRDYETLEDPTSGTHDAYGYCLNCGHDAEIGKVEVEMTMNLKFVLD